MKKQKYNSHNKVDLTGKKFKYLTVISLAPKHKFSNSKVNLWICQCDCGKKKIIRGFNLTSGNTKSCGCQQRKRKSNNSCWKGYKEISGGYFNKLEYCARSRNIPFKITIKQAWNLFVKQEEKCSLTGLKLNFQSCYNKRDGTASLDRINNDRGYIQGNVQWIHKDVNQMKMDFTEDELFEYCKLICINKKLL